MGPIPTTGATMIQEDPEAKLYLATIAAKDILKDAKRIAILTGAGISTDSGIPDFRGPNGLWTLNPDAEKLSTIENYKSNPEMRQRSWNMYVNGWGKYEPNSGHFALSVLSSYHPNAVTIITQNIDGLHTAVGHQFKDVIEIHGNLNEIKCIGCNQIWKKKDYHKSEWNKTCVDCGGLLKPNIIYFGENLDPILWTNAIAAASSSDVFIAIGTSLQVWPAADLVTIANDWHHKIIIINGSPTEYDAYAHVVLNGSISDILTELIQ